MSRHDKRGNLGPLAEHLRQRQRTLQERFGLVRPAPESEPDTVSGEPVDAPRDAAESEAER